MKRFRFTLQALLTLRQREEQKALEAYSRALLARQQAIEQLAAAERELAAVWNERRAQLAAGGPAARLARLHEHCAELEARKAGCDRALERAQVNVNRAHQKMILARQRREAVEVYRAHQRVRHDRELQREEQKQIEELAGRRAPNAFGARELRFAPGVN